MPDPATMLSFDPTTAPGPAVAPVAASGSPQDFLSRTLAIDADLKAGKLNAAPSTAPAPPADAPPIVGPSDSPIRDANNFVETATDYALSGLVGLPRNILRAGDFINRNVIGAEPGSTGHELDTAGSFLPSPEGTLNALAKDSGGIYVPASQGGKLGQAALAATLGGALTGVPASALPLVAASGVTSQIGSQLLPSNPELGAVLGGAAVPVGSLAASMVNDAARGALTPLLRPLADKEAPVVDQTTGAPILHGTVTGQPGDIAPITAKPGVLDIAAAKLRAAASDPGAALDKLTKAVTTQQGASEADLVPGSLPTTAQITQDPGLARIERANVASGAIPARAAQQQAARVAATESLRPDQPEAATVGQTVRTALENLQKEQESAIAPVRQAVADKVNQSAVLPPGSTDAPLETYGAALRGGAGPNDEAAANLLAQQNAVKAKMAQLHEAVDPGDTLTVPGVGVRQAAQDILEQKSKFASPLSGDEAKLFSDVAEFPDVAKFSDLAALRTRTGDLMRQELETNGSTQTYRRLTQFNKALNDATETGIDNAAKQEAAEVAAGQRDPADTIKARFEQDQQSAAARGRGAVDSIGSGPSPTGPVGTDAGQIGSGVPTAGRPGDAGSDSQVAVAPAARVETPSEPITFDDAARARDKAAREFSAREYYAKFTQAPGVGEVLKPGQNKSTFDKLGSEVPNILWKSGAGGAERVKAYIAAGGDPAILKDYALFSLRKAAQNADGTLDASRVLTWQKAHQDGVATLEQAAPGFKALIDNNTTASTLVQQATARAAEAVDAFKKSAAAKFLGEADPVRTVGEVLQSKTSAPQMRQILQVIEKNKDAKDGLQSAAVDYMLQNKLNGPESFNKFVRNATPGLNLLFGDDGAAIIVKVARDYKRAEDTLKSTKSASGSDTAINQAAAKELGNPDESVLHSVILAEGLNKAGELASGVLSHAGLVGRTASGIGAQIAGFVLKSKLDAGLARADELVKMAGMSPPLAKVLLERMPAPSKAPEYMKRFQTQFNRAMVAAAQPHAKEQ